MTVLSRGARVRRGGRRPGWVLLTALLVLAMGASSALVFTNRVELLKLAVILALWAAVAGAFVSVLYRRQSDADQSRVRDLKLVYDLQLDREISARREYELTVESQLRRELASELRAHAADDLAALRAELSALRTSLEILFDTDLAHRPALETLETDAPRARAYSDWERNGEGKPVDWVSSDRLTSARQDGSLGRDGGRVDDTAIIDVPEEPLLPPRQPPHPRERFRAQYDVPQDVPYVVSQEPPYMTQPPDTEPPVDPLRRQPPPPEPPEPPEPQSPVPGWQPVGADGQWSPADPPDNRTVDVDRTGASGGVPAGQRRARHADDDFDDSPGESGPSWPTHPYQESGRRARARHSAEYRDYGVRNFAGSNEAPAAEAGPAAPPMGMPAAAAHSPQPNPQPMPPPMPPPAAPSRPHMAPPPPPEPAPRHRGADAALDRYGPEDGPPSGGQSVAELLARLQAEPAGGGRRRRRDGRHG
ncbi:DUF6779 domain-containing protein [Mycobacterium sp.]|uniref:DUF6779 domain-containing protein n=1 Tax=Mycobacterium sp. TaxID=1785 RepID=UPI0025DC2F8B|nr:DUF6779 domain-containing protein [Mycobacterium sp.]MBW0015759.1 hypothetical protein [Mycobacterium sp.]